MSVQNYVAGIGAVALVWRRADLTRQESLSYWRDQHGELVSQMPGCLAYRQHFFSAQPVLALESASVDVSPSEGWIPLGVAESLFGGYLSAAGGMLSRVTRAALRDERNAFRRVLLYATRKGDCRYHIDRAATTDADGSRSGSRVMLLLRRSGGGLRRRRDFRRLVHHRLPELVASDPAIAELHSYVFMRHSSAMWRSVDMSKHNPAARRYHGAILIAGDRMDAISAVLADPAFTDCIEQHRDAVAAIHAFSIESSHTKI